MKDHQLNGSRPTVAGLKKDCHYLIEAIAKRPGAIKLLFGAKATLRTFAAYKSNRNLTRRNHHDS